MKPLQTWLDEYARDHRHPHNRLIHKIAVPLIFFSIVGVLHLIPLKVLEVPIGDWFTGLITLSYTRWGTKAALIMLFQWLVALSLTVSLHDWVPDYTVGILIGIFISAWIGQFAGHSIEGHRPAFFTDLQYLLIGPLWIWLGH